MTTTKKETDEDQWVAEEEDEDDAVQQDSTQPDEDQWKTEEDDEDEQLHPQNPQQTSQAPQTPQIPQDPQTPPELTLNVLADSIALISTRENIPLEEIRHKYFDTALANIAQERGKQYEDVILYASEEEDDKYVALLCSYYPTLEKHIKKRLNPTNRPELIEMLTQAIEPLILLAHSKVSDGEGVDEPIEEQQPEPEEVKPYDPNEIIEEEGFDESEVVAITNDILKVYDELYAPCFVNKPVGILTEGGILAFDPERGSAKLMKDFKLYAKNLYESMVRYSNGYLPAESPKKTIDGSFFNRDGTLNHNYAPIYHLRNINGLKANGEKCETYSEFSRYLREDVYAKVRAVLSNFEGDTLGVQNSLKDLFTNCIIIDDLDRTKSLQLRYRLSNFPTNFGRFMTQNSKRIFATDTAKDISDTTSSLNITNILFVFDRVSFNTEILFAYKAQEKLIRSGVTPSAQNVLLGRGMDGMDVTENFGDAGNILFSIIAGSRSGKGVVTLSILASLFADDCPVFYADYKPDMASALWDFERKLRVSGLEETRIFSIDALANQKSEGSDANGNEITIKPVRPIPFGYNMPDIGLSRQDFSVVPYLKTIQMITVMANLRANYGLRRGKKMFLVLDEAQKLNGHYVSTLEKMVTIMTENKPKKGEEKNEKYLYAERFIQIFQKDLTNSTQAVSKTTGGTGQAAFILLGQTGDPGEWNFGSLGGWKDGPFGNMIANTNIRYTGRDSGTSPSYGRPTFAYPGSDFKEERGYFLRQRGSKVATTREGVQMIKTYLVLNENDFDIQAHANGTLRKDTYTGSLLNNINDPALRDSIVREDYLNPDGTIRESIGFSGLMKQIMSGKGGDKELSEKMSAGYVLMWEVFCKMGLDQRYPNLEAYLYDCSPESILTDAELLDMYLIGDGQLDPNANGEGGFGDTDIFTENLEVLGKPTPQPIPQPQPHQQVESTSQAQAEGVQTESQADLPPSDLSMYTSPQPTPQPTPQNEKGTTFEDDFDEPPTFLTQDEEEEEDFYDPQSEQEGDTLAHDLFDTMPDPQQGGGTWTGGLDVDPVPQPVHQPTHFEPEPEPTHLSPHQHQQQFQQPKPQQQTQPQPEVWEQPSQPQQSQQTQQNQPTQPDQPVYVSPNTSSHYDNVYNQPVQLETNPFRATRSNKGVATLKAFKDISKELVKQIELAYGSLQRVETLEITNAGIVINNIAFRPQFDQQFIDSLPFDVKQDVSKGNLTPLLHFDAIYQFKHMHTLIIENPRLAEGRVKREMALPDKLTWYKLLQRKKYLKRVIIGGQEITDLDSCDAYQNGGRRGYELEEQVSEKLGIKDAFVNSPLSRVWGTRPAKIATGALGATLGVKAVSLGVAVFGGWGLLFGAFAGYGAYKKYVKKD